MVGVATPTQLPISTEFARWLPQELHRLPCVAHTAARKGPCCEHAFMATLGVQSHGVAHGLMQLAVCF
eukprot:3775021-Amphidinium_carterae.1